MTGEKRSHPREAPKGRATQKQPPPPFVRFEKVVALCGHQVDFGLFEDRKDKYREGRRQKVTGRPCPACRQQAHEARREQEQAAGRLRRAAKARQQRQTAPQPGEQAQGRLPDGSRFAVVYDAGKEEWSGTLTVGAETFTASASGVFKLLSKLDRLYRASLPSAETAPSQVPEEPSS
jgi:hypothetical protein